MPAGRSPRDLRKGLAMYFRHLRRPAQPVRHPRQDAAVILPPEAMFEVAYVTPGPGPVKTTVFEGDAAMDTARRLSACGQFVDVALVLGNGSRRLIASFADGQLLPGAAVRVPAAADAARAPVTRLRGTGDVFADAHRYPDGVSPLPVSATSCGPLRPGRLLHPDGTRLDCLPGDPMPGGYAGEPWTGIADGVVPASSQPGAVWLQVVRRTSADHALVTVHPALVAPAGVDPYGCMDRRQRRRYMIFDAAEAAGASTAWLPSQLIDAGDFILAAGRDDITHVGQATPVCGKLGLSVRILADDLSGGTDIRIHRGGELVQVTIPVRHPAETGPQARRLFAPSPAKRVMQAPWSLLLGDDR